MEMVNFCIMIIGTNSSGKTTLARGIHKEFSEIFGEENEFVEWKEDFEKIEKDGTKKIENKKCAYTILSKESGNIGLMSESRPTGGADSVSSRQQTKRSVEELMKVKTIVSLEPIMAAGPMVAELIDLIQDNGGRFMLIHLDLDEESNLKRLKVRRGARLGVNPEEIAVTEKTKEKLQRKRRNFRNLFKRFEDEVDFGLSIDTAKLSQKKVLKKVFKAIIENLRNS